MGFARAGGGGGPAGAFRCCALLCVGRGVPRSPRAVWGELRAKGVTQKGDGDPEDIILVTGAPFPTCPRQVAKSMEQAHGLARLLAGLAGALGTRSSPWEQMNRGTRP